MSEAARVQGILLAHGGMAEGMVDAVIQISGVEADALVPISNKGLAPPELLARVESVLEPGATIVFTDLQSGSCTFVARKLCQDHANVAVLTGANLPLLLDFVLHRDMPLSELVPRLLEKAHTGICCTPDELEDHARRAVSSR